MMHFSGEALLHPGFEEILWLVHRYKIRSMVSTNGSLLSSAQIEALLDTSLFLIVFSLDAFHAETFRRIRVGGNFDSVQANVLAFLAHRAARGLSTPLTQVQLVRSIQTEEEIFLFIERWRSTTVDTIHVRRYSSRADQVRWKYKALGASGQVGWMRSPCFDPWRHLILMWDGTVVPCCADFSGKIPLGNAREQSLVKIWNGVAMQELRRAHVTGDGLPWLCQNCREIPRRRFGRGGPPRGLGDNSREPVTTPAGRAASPYLPSV
jgi:MoaA/NifB/PqqE/SkfB family radical SAM enzyme